MMKNNDSLGIKKALLIILLFGVVSLLGDVIYEGARGVNGPYLQILGLNAAMVGIIAGLGEFLGYAIRVVSGYFSDRTKAYWLFTFIGYGLLVFIPLLSLTGIWQIAGMFIIFERVGKAIRSPARDTLLANTAKQVGTGWGFGLHEFLDQIGAIIGPLVFAVFFYSLGSSQLSVANYQKGYSFLWVPFFFLIIALSIAYKLAKNKTGTEIQSSSDQKQKKLSQIFWIYLSFTFLTTLGFASFVLIGYHIKVKSLMPDTYIPLLYAFAMLVDALFALGVGKLYDVLKTHKKNEKGGLIILAVIPLISAAIPLLVFSTSLTLIFIGIFVWGIVMGTHETIMRAAIADLTPESKRGTGYGIFNASYGLAMFIGSATIGFLYDYSLALLITIVILVEIAAMLLFFKLRKEIA